MKNIDPSELKNWTRLIHNDDPSSCLEEFDKEVRRIGLVLKTVVLAEHSAIFFRISTPDGKTIEENLCKYAEEPETVKLLQEVKDLLTNKVTTTSFLTKPQAEELKKLGQAPQSNFGSARVRVQNNLINKRLAELVIGGEIDRVKITPKGRTALVIYSLMNPEVK